MIDQNSPSIGRFDKSFLVHMIRDFFLVLVIVTVVEFSLKAALVYYNYYFDGTDEAEIVAEDLAENVRSIMRNEGGPVAARTMYPILEENWSDLGYVIAIEPAPVTVASIEEGFGFTPRGIPAEDWPEGRFQTFKTDILAEEFCLACHTQAAVGDVLGTVTVRNYLYRDFALWLKDVQLTGILAAGKIVLHSLLLFLILRARLEPLMELRSVISNLARAYGRLDHRAEIRTSDEFGVLARDLNLFLDRITGIVAELDTVLAKVVTANDDIIAVQGALRDTVDDVVSGVRRLERQAMLSAKQEPRLSNEWFDAVRGSIAALDGALTKVEDTAAATDLLETLRQVVANAEAQTTTNETIYTSLADLGDQSETLKSSTLEMTRLEERLKAIIETCGALVGRLKPENKRAED
ncbi:HAMP domain-containing protein [uncultured Roseobacter sp.]|uniref:HAMP domain-containing protein n=1 Tax=uncultured Roseobacter sp. TaxID=114847 RepID=UPI002636EB88|nr:HAMP domain-containing protein [uncultured Roseobacter sp.]